MLFPRPSYSLFADLCEKRGTNAYKVSIATKVPASSFTTWKRGTSFPKNEKLQKIANYFGVPISYFFGENPAGPIPNIPGLFVPNTQAVPLLGEIACGQPISADEFFEGYVEVSGRQRVDFCLRAIGDSMINARIYDGDIVFIRQQPEVENGEIAAVVIDGAVTLKRVYVEQDRIILRAENPKIRPMIFKKTDFSQFRILGKAIAFQGEVI